MSVTFIDTAGSTLPSTTEPLDFTTTLAVEAVSVSFGSSRPEERVYRDGVFLYPYLRSTKSSLTFSLVRDGGWPGNPTVYVDEATPAANVAALLTVGYASALAQWSCLRSGSVLSGNDRSGNAYHCGDVNPVAYSDLIPGRAAMAPKGNGTTTSPVILSRAATAALKLTGELTLMARVCLAGYNAAGTGGYVVSYGNQADGTSGGNIQYAMVCEQAGASTSRLIYFCESGAGKTGQTAYSNSVTLNDGLWHFLCIRRSASGAVVDVQVDGDTKQTTGLSAPTAGSTTFPRLGGNTLTTATELVNGLVADVGVWGTRLSDGQVAAARTIMMGL